MCLSHSVQETLKFLLQSKKEIIVYKVLSRTRDYETGKIIYESPYQYKKYNSGWVKATFSQSEIPKPRSYDTNIHDGIHVFRTIKAAKAYMSSYKWKGLQTVFGNRIIIPAKALIRDLIGCNETQLVFSKIYITLPKDNGKAWKNGK